MPLCVCLHVRVAVALLCACLQVCVCFLFDCLLMYLRVYSCLFACVRGLLVRLFVCATA